MVGQSKNGANAIRAVIWRSGSTIAVPLGELIGGGSRSFAYAVNATGIIVGEALTAGDAASHAVRWTDNGDGGFNIADLGTLGGTDSFAGAVNGSGLIVGGAETLSNGSHAFFYISGTMYDLNDYGSRTG